MTATTEPATEPAAEPYPDVATQVRDELRRAWLRVEYQIRLAWQRESSSRRTDEVTGPTEIGHLFSLARGEPTTAAVADDASGADTVLEQWLAQHYHTEQRTLASARASRRSPLVDLRVTFELTPRQWSLLMFALLPELDPNLDQAYRYLSRDPSCRGLDARLLAQLVYDKPQTRSLMARDPSPRSPLLHYRLLEITAGETLMYRRIRAATRLVYMLDGDQLELDPELGDVAELRRGAVAGVFPAATIERATAAMRSTDVVLTIQGQRGLGKRLLLQHAAAHWGRALIVIDAKRFAQQPAPTQAQTVHALLRELELLDALPVFAELDDAQTGDDRDATPPCFDMFLDEWRGPVAITVRGERVPRIHQRPIVDIALEVPSRDDRVTLWRGEMPSLTADDADGLASRFAIPGGVIVAAVQAAQAGRMPDDGPPGAGQLDSAVAAQLHQRISRLGKKLPTPYDLDDLIVDCDTRAAVLEIAAAAKGRRKIRDHFELRGAAGISVLFSGHPGVGKTMSGTVLARQLGLDIYEIDLSQVVSKWLGETEKNLSDVFDAAEPGHVVLLFNEADSLFGKRTADVKSSNDRYANLETNYLLQRLERFNGLAILTTNLTSSIDQAFKRRFAYDVFFSFPSPDMRAELWRRTLPKRSRSASIDYDALADKYELTGGFIKVACERAAYVAGARGTEIDEKLLRATVERMYRERGKLSAVGPLE